MKKKLLIVSPHADDELINCFTILSNTRNLIIHIGYDTSELDSVRKLESLSLMKFFKNIEEYYYFCDLSFFNDSDRLRQYEIFYFPDPVYEKHFLHRYWGVVGEKLLRTGYNVVFYSIDAPYIFKLKEWEKKKELLDSVYPSQKSLWELDRKFYYFEGFCQWRISC